MVFIVVAFEELPFEPGLSRLIVRLPTAWICEILISSFTHMIQCWLLLSGLFKLSPVRGLPSERQLKSTISEEPEGERRFSRTEYRGRGEEGDFFHNTYL